MKTVALIASYDREKVLPDVLRCIKPQVDDIVLVGSSSWCEGVNGSDVEKKIAREFGCVYVDHKNSPLGCKWQAGLNKCRELKPDVVLICGSDDLLEHDYMADGLEELENGMLVGVGTWLVVRLVKDKKVRFVNCCYKDRKEPIGAGRIIRSDLLDKVDWQIFPSEGGIGCDTYSYGIMSKHVQRKCYGQLTGVVLSIKSDWHCLDSWGQMVESPQLIVKELNNFDELKMFIFPDIDFEKYRI